MTQQHPDLPEEQAYIDHAYDCLNSSREAAWRMNHTGGRFARTPRAASRKGTVSVSVGTPISPRRYWR